MSSDRYNLTEHGLIAKFQQPCVCNAEGPARSCTEGRRLWRATMKASNAELAGKITLQECDAVVAQWQAHLGA